MVEIKGHVDLTTGQIHGCKEGSLKWWHEKGHLEFNSDPNKSFLIVIRTMAFEFWMLTIMFAIFFNWVFYVALAGWTIYTVIGLYEEMWCNNYAKKNYRKVYKG